MCWVGGLGRGKGGGGGGGRIRGGIEGVVVLPLPSPLRLKHRLAFPPRSMIL